MHYRFGLKPQQFALQRLQTVRKALRNALTNLKKTYQSVLELSLSGAKDGNHSAGEDAHEMTKSDVVSFALRTFALVKGL